jgi:hypothetical protein
MILIVNSDGKFDSEKIFKLLKLNLKQIENIIKKEEDEFFK